MINSLGTHIKFDVIIAHIPIGYLTINVVVFLHVIKLYEKNPNSSYPLTFSNQNLSHHFLFIESSPQEPIFLTSESLCVSLPT